MTVRTAEGSDAVANRPAVTERIAVSTGTTAPAVARTVLEAVMAGAAVSAASEGATAVAVAAGVCSADRVAVADSVNVAAWVNEAVAD